MKLYTLFLKTQDHEHHTLLHWTYPFSSIKGVPHHLRTQSQPFSSHPLSTKQMPLERCGGSLRYHLFGSHHCIKEIHAFSMISLHVHKLLTCQWARGGGMPKKVIVGEVPRRGPTAYHFIYHFGQKRYPFPIHSIDKRYPFYIHSLERSIPFNCCKCT